MHGFQTRGVICTVAAVAESRDISLSLELRASAIIHGFLTGPPANCRQRFNSKVRS